MPIDHHLIPRRPVGAILAARRREKAALAARCRSFGAIAKAMAHYARNPLPAGTWTERSSRWERLGDYTGAAAAMDLPASPSPPTGNPRAAASTTADRAHQDGRQAASTRARDAAATASLGETRP